MFTFIPFEISVETIIPKVFYAKLEKLEFFFSRLLHSNEGKKMLLKYIISGFKVW